MNGHLGNRAAAFVDGALDPEESARAADHLSSCAPCRADVAEQQRVRGRLRHAADPSGVGRPSSVLMAALASMPTTGPPTSRAVVVPDVTSQRVILRRGAVAGVAVGATVLATAWGVGGQIAVVGPPSAQPDRLSAQHAATAGELPFWGALAAETGAASNTAAAMIQRGATASASVTYVGVEVASAAEDASRSTRVSEISHPALDSTASSSGINSGIESGIDAVTLLRRSYTLVPEGTEPIAGRAADRVAAYTPAGVLAARYWFDRASGLPLAREVRDRAGRSLTERTFTSVAIGDPSLLPRHLPVATTAGWTESATGAEPASLESQGWKCPETVASASGLTALDAMVVDTAHGPILQVVYTDGLRSLSLFEQRARLSERALEGFVASEVAGHRVHRAQGATDTVTWASGSLVFTVVADADLVDVDAVVAALPHDPVDPGSRSLRGLVRVGSWFDPFG